jgi:predicted 3-demethylubiquinone-9 3-methyltransferase (glyoxalase superfamily)
MDFSAKVRTCLGFNGNGEEAVDFYLTLLAGSHIENVVRPDPEGPALVIEFRLGDYPMMILNDGPKFEHGMGASISILTDDQEETDRLWDMLTGNGGKESMCGWLEDRFGVSWQIVPKIMPQILSSPDRPAVERAMQAMFAMRKIDIAAIEKAFKGE